MYFVYYVEVAAARLLLAAAAGWGGWLVDWLGREEIPPLGCCGAAGLEH